MRGFSGFASRRTLIAHIRLAGEQAMRRQSWPVLFVALAAFSTQALAQSVTVVPKKPSLTAGQTKDFFAEVAGISDPSVTWLVDGIRWGAPMLGTIDGSGQYTAPIDLQIATPIPIEAASDTLPKISGTAVATVAPPTLSGPRFYVSTSGSDGAAGSESAPWRTIQHAVDSVPAGATINVETGTYNEIVTITRSGSKAAGFITLTAAASQLPVLDGTGLGVPNGEGGLITIQDASWIRVSGFEIRHFTSSSADDVPVGIYVAGSGGHIELLYNHIHDIVTSVTSSDGDALGIAVYGTEAPAALRHIVIDSNELDHLVTGFSESLAISGNVMLWQVTNNLIHDNDNIGIDIAGFEQTAPDPEYDVAREGLVQGNTVYNITSSNNPAYQGSLGADGIYVDGGTEITIQQNLVYDDDIGIELASEHSGHKSTDVIARDNLVYGSNLVGITIGGYDATRGGTADCVITNNTLFDNDTTQSGSGEFQIQYHARNNTFKNNILYANAQSLMVNAYVAAPSDPAMLNYNLYYATSGAANATFTWLGQSYNGFVAYQGATGNDAHSQFADPKFTSTAATPVLTLQSESPAIGSGRNLGLVDLGLFDYAGNPRLTGALVDIGAYQD
jgi:hypothetical protein